MSRKDSVDFRRFWKEAIRSDCIETPFHKRQNLYFDKALGFDRDQ